MNILRALNIVKDAMKDAHISFISNIKDEISKSHDSGSIFAFVFLHIVISLDIRTEWNL